MIEKNMLSITTKSNINGVVIKDEEIVSVAEGFVIYRVIIDEHENEFIVFVKREEREDEG